MEQDRELARIERRAMAAYERELLAELRELAVVEAGCSAAVTRDTGLGSIELHLAGRSLVLAGVTGRARAEVGALSTSSVIRIVDAGRYDSCWWIAVTDGRRRVVVLALRAQLRPDDGGVHHAIAQVA